MIYRNFFKPFSDYFIAIIGLILFAPILIITAVFIRLETNGPILFIQERLGRNGCVFKLYKFRSMTHKKRNVNIQIFEGHPEVTVIGKIIRRLKIDELPQFFNVILGDMSLVGPRPSLPNLKEEFNEDGEYRIKVKPGCTNLASVNGSIYLTWPERWVFDRYYVENLTFLLDIEIIIKTIVVVLFGEKFFYKNRMSS